MPPCLIKQVQGMVDEFAATLAAASVQIAPAPDANNIGRLDKLQDPKERLSLARKDKYEAINEVSIYFSSIVAVYSIMNV